MAGKHTPGPWSITSVSMDTGAVGIAKDRIMIAQVHNGYSFMDLVQDRHPAVQYANARLIALTPEFYEYVESSALNGCATAQALIAKAKGEDGEASNG